MPGEGGVCGVTLEVLLGVAGFAAGVVAAGFAGPAVAGIAAGFAVAVEVAGFVVEAVVVAGFFVATAGFPVVVARLPEVFADVPAAVLPVLLFAVLLVDEDVPLCVGVL